jgi:excisionase family DNA binding protein
MIAEVEMTTEHSKTNSRDIRDVAAAPIARPSLITVREAAQRLAVSRSTVYRIDRETGPFRFVVDGRRIFIDQASLESHIANSRRNRSNDGPLKVESVLPCQQPANESETRSETDQLQLTAPEMATLNASLSTSTRQGQRELIMREHRQSCAFFYSY